MSQQYVHMFPYTPPGRGLPHCPGQPVARFDHSLHEQILLRIHSEPPWGTLIPLPHIISHTAGVDVDETYSNL